MTLGVREQPMFHESFVGVDRGRPRFCLAARFLRAFFYSSCGFFLFTLTKAGGGVFSFSNSSRRA
jgi:hypothetical protein